MTIIYKNQQNNKQTTKTEHLLRFFEEIWAKSTNADQNHLMKWNIEHILSKS